MPSPLGDLFLVASAIGLQKVLFSPIKTLPISERIEGTASETLILRQAQEELREFFEGKRESFDIHLDVHGTDFQMAVWKCLKKIPYGHTCTYGEIAQSLGRPNAARAVGMANRRNPLCVVIPCHRVVATDRYLGGYVAGLKSKKLLLELERRSREPERYRELKRKRLGMEN
jgi:methylated-DNA-[protein]-cysteine S-methyltransferase